MRNIIRKILLEGKSLTPIMDYYEKIAKKIADSIEINHEMKKLLLPFINPTGSHGIVAQDRSIYTWWYTDDYFSMEEFPLYLNDRYAIPNQKGILMSMKVLIFKYLKERLIKETKEMAIKPPLTESESGKDKFIDLVVKELSYDTIYHYDEKRGDRSPVTIPWGNPKMRITFHFFVDTLTHPFAWEDGPFKRYVVSTYGVPDDIVESIWLKYKQAMNDRYFDGKGIKQSKWISPISETIKLPVEIGDTVLMGKFKNKKVVVKDIEWNEKGDLMINGKPALKMRITKKFKKKGTITESEDKKQRYINYVIDKMVKETRFRREDRKVSFPFHDHGRYKGFYDEFINVGMLSTMKSFFYDFIAERYGITDTMEALTIWSGYILGVSDIIYHPLKHGI